MTEPLQKIIKKILIANRGEIAVRIMRTCRTMGIQTVAVYSTADSQSLFVSLADEAYELGAAPSTESYLCIDKILKVAKESGADAIHPGYGFLSEKAEFSAACAKAGLIFLGPHANSISAMGDKLAARDVAQNAGVPIVPGTDEPINDLHAAKKLAKTFGYPVLLKAAAGGGGKGMRVVHAESEFEDAFTRASSEAAKSFADARVFIEKYILNPRHVEVQVLCDAHGQAFFLHERECSTQRRHQKIIEEAPCAYLREDVRQSMAAASLRLAKAVNYLGVGTLEFLVDAEQNFYFLEMNTRLQVEHTVTEQILDLDLVRLQIQVAQGEKLTLVQEKLKPRGHAVQCRIYAEDATQNFMPSPGRIVALQEPVGEGVRVDTGVVLGSVIPIYYDPMIAKLIVWDTTRDLAILKMQNALQNFCVLVVTTNINFLHKIIQSEDFKKMQIHTQYLDQHLTALVQNLQPSEIPDVVKVALALSAMRQSQVNAPQMPVSDWWQAGLSLQLRGPL